MSRAGRGRGNWLALSALREVDSNCSPGLGDEDQEVWVRSNNVCHHMRPKVSINDCLSEEAGLYSRGVL
eukprot:3829900-Lingulodinium_polyedra.AAC.1